MNENITSLLNILAGVNMAFAIINLSLGLQKGSEKAYLFLGIIGSFISVYYLMFPYLNFGNPIPIFTFIGFSFFMSTFALLPWFFGAFTGFKKPVLQWVLSLGMGLSMLILILQPQFGPFALWNLIAHFTLLSIIIYGIRASQYMIKESDRLNGRILGLGILLLLLLTIDDIFRMHAPDSYPFKVLESFLPLDYFMVVFVLVMGVKMIFDMQHKYRLEKQNANKEKRWRTLLERIDLFVIGLNKDGAINYVNPYFLKLTGYSKEETLQKNWFDLFVINEEKSILIKKHHEFLSSQNHNHHQNPILTKTGEQLQIFWSNLVISDEEGQSISTLSIGANITERELAYQEIKLLKAKLEEENIQLRAEFKKGSDSDKILGDSDAIRYVMKRSLLVAPTTSTVLLEGETGVGKELIANYIQKNSDLSDQAFIKINCAAIPATLIESELFGHEKGAFTGASKQKTGMVEMADRGTLFLDEIAELPLELQAKLLRFLQEGEYLPLGSTTTKRVNVRIIASTNKELLNEIEKGTFRNDLYYRLYVYPITIPPLRNRIKDIPILVEYFINKFSIKHKKAIKSVSKLLMDEFLSYQWPGNIRELENVVERAVIIADSETLKKRDINIFSMDSKLEQRPSKSFESLEEIERAHILKSLSQTNWQIHGKNGAAELLQMNPSTLRSRIKKMDIQKG